MSKYKHKEITAVWLVEKALREAQDFMTRAMLQEVTKQSSNRVIAALCHLRKYGCVDVVVEADGRSWWFALPETCDTRIKHLVERAPEVRPRKSRKAKSIKKGE